MGTFQREQIEASLRETLVQSLAPSTQSSMQSVLRTYLQFKENWEWATGQSLEHAVAVLLFAEKKRGEGAKKSTVLQYTMSLAGALKRLDGDLISHSQLVQDYRQALKRGGALLSERQAKPALFSQVQTVLDRLPMGVLRLAIALCWAGAARASDVLRLRRSELVIRSDSSIQVHWTKTKSDPYQLGRFSGVVLRPQETRLLFVHLSSLTPQQQLFPFSLTTKVISDELKKTCPALTSHSLRRGAVQHLVGRNVDLEMIRQLTRHVDVNSVVRYAHEAGGSVAASSAETSRLLLS